MSKTTLRPPMRRDGDGHKHSYSYSYGYSGYGREKRPRQLNVRLVVASLVVVLVGAPSIYFWHAYQTQKLSDSLWAYGEKKAAEEDWREASAAFYRVWEIQQDPKLLGDAVLAYDKLAARTDRRGVMAAYQRAIGGLPERLDLRSRLAELLVLEKQYKSALTQAERVLAKEPQNRKAQKCRAISLLALFQSNRPIPDVDVLEELKRAFVDQQGDVDLAVALVTHIREDLRAKNGSELAEQADGVMNRLVASQPQNIRARLIRYQYRTKYGLPGAKADIAQAVLLAPKNPEVIKEAASGALRDAARGLNHSDYLSARQLFKDLISLQPEEETGYLGLGDTEFLVAGNVEQAIVAWNQGRVAAGDSLALLLRIAEAQTNAHQFTDLEQTLKDIDQYIVTMSSPSVIPQRNWASSSAALFRGKMALAQGRPFDAIMHLKRAADVGGQAKGEQFSSNEQSVTFSAWSSLGNTYRELGRTKDAADAFDRALKIQPDNESILLASAEAWGLVGDLDRAIKQVTRALELDRHSAEVYQAHAQYLFERELAVPSRERDWGPFEAALKVARQQLANSWQLRLLEVDYAIHRDNELRDVSGALGKLLTLERDFPLSLGVWQRLPFVYQTLGLPADADRTLNKLESLTSSSTQTKLLTIELLLWRGDVTGARKVLQAISEDGLNDQDRLSLELAKLSILSFEADEKALDDALIAYRSEDPQDSFAVERLLDRRLTQASPTKIPTNQDLIKDLQKRQPASQATWQYYVARMELSKDSPNMGTVQELLASLTNRLPNWSRTQELAGRFALSQDNPRDARAAFESAVAKPRPNPELVRLLLDENARDLDFLSSIRLIERHRQLPVFSKAWIQGQWDSLQSRLDFAELDRALQKRQETPSLMWSAVVTEGSLPEGDPQQLDSLMLSLWQAGNTSEEASRLLGELQGHSFPSEDERAFVLGQAYELAGELGQAKQYYRQVTGESVRRLKAEMYAGNASQQMVRQDFRHQDIEEQARRSKMRLEAIMKLRRAGRNDLESARQLLQSLVVGNDVESGDRILLSNCLEQLGEFPSAVGQLEQVVEHDASAYHLSILIDFLLRNGEYDKAEVWIDQLEEQTGWEQKTVLLRARWMVATNRFEEIRPFVEMYATQQFRRNPRNPAAEMRAISNIYRRVGLIEDAKRWLQMLADRYPAEAEPLSQLLVDNDEMDRAIQRCVKQLNDQPTVETATLLARILVYGDATSATVANVMPLLNGCREKFPDNASFLFALGNVHIRLGQPADAIELLTRVTELQPGHYLAWNNLAAILAEEDGREQEAMDTINQAIQQAAYEIPTLIDTKAVVLLHRGQYEAAAELLLNDVTGSQAAVDPRFYFHLALCLERLQDPSGAEAAFQEALGLGLEGSFLTKFERREFERMNQRLEQL